MSHAKRLVDRDAVRAAVRAFPELRSLVDLRRGGDWAFTAVVRHRAVVSLHGVRTWPGGWADALGLLYTTDAQAVRTNRHGETVWKRDGGLVEVIGALLELPPPHARTAPHLAIGTAPLRIP